MLVIMLGYVVRSKNGNNNSPTGLDSSIEVSSIGSLLAVSESVQCSFSEDKDDSTAKLLMYASGGWVSGVTKIVSKSTPGQTVERFLITDGKIAYLWTSNDSQGEVVNVDPTSPKHVPGRVDFDFPVDFSCKPWTVDENKFVPPANITFVDAKPTPAAQ